MAKGKYEKWLEPDGLLLLEAWARDGLTDEQIAKNMCISRSTLNEWRRKYSDISDALKRGKEVVDIEVENALFKSAVGYEYEEVTREPLFNPITGEPIKGKDGNQIIAITKIVKKQVQPSNTAQIFWLKNRLYHKWRDKQDIEHSGGISFNNPFAELSTDDLRKLIKDG